MLRDVFAIFICALAAVAGCSSDPSTTSSGTGGGHGGTGGAGGAGSCAPVAQDIGQEGGTLSHCGATLIVPAGAVDAKTSFGIAVEASPPPPPFERELAGPAFRFTPEGQVFLAPVSVTVPHDSGPDRFELARVEQGGFVSIEACQVTETTLQQDVYALATFAALRDINHYPPSTSGLGGGTVDLDFLASNTTFDLDAKGNYGIYASRPDGGRTVTLNATRAVPGGLESLRIDMTVDAGGASGSLVQVEWISTVTSGGYQYIDGLVGSGGMLAVHETPEGGLAGQLEATLKGGSPPHDEGLAATFDVKVEKYAFPMELSCLGGPEG